MMSQPRSLQARERNLISIYSNCQLGMSPRAFYSKWQVSYEQIAMICDRSLSTVQRWFKRGRYYQRPLPSDLRHLALMDFLLEHFEVMDEQLLNLLCPPNQEE